MNIYHYHPTTRELISSGFARLDPVDRNRYIIPANATIIAPPAFDATKFKCVFNGVAWVVEKLPILEQKFAPLNASGMIDPSLLNGTVLVTVSEAVFAGAFVNIFTDIDGKTKCRLATATAERPPIGFVLAATAVGSTVRVYSSSHLNFALKDLIIGKTYYINPLVPGGVTNVAPAVPNIAHVVGNARSTTSLIYSGSGISEAAPAIVPDGWTDAVLENGWVSFGAPHETVGYSKDPHGNIHIKGAAKTGADGSVIFTLPGGCRPAATMTVPTIGDAGSLAFLRIDNLGNVSVHGVSVSLYVSLRCFFKP